MHPGSPLASADDVLPVSRVYRVLRTRLRDMADAFLPQLMQLAAL